ncbi:unnamed protein product [Closterium sp. NIES-54]
MNGESIRNAVPQQRLDEHQQRVHHTQLHRTQPLCQQRSRGSPCPPSLHATSSPTLGGIIVNPSPSPSPAPPAPAPPPPPAVVAPLAARSAAAAPTAPAATSAKIHSTR